jgi:2-dehydropantoate 2-reductase
MTMRICVFGAGAVGGHFAVRLATAGHEVAVVARGSHLEAISAHGLTLVSGGERVAARVAASNDPAALGRQDIVLVTLKAHDAPGFAGVARPLLGDDTAVIFAHNGIPWWYGDGFAPPQAPLPDLTRLDPAGALRTDIGIGRTLGGVIYSSNDLAEPGVIVNNSPARNRLLIGEVDDADSDRVRRIRAALTEAGIDSPPLDSIRRRIWGKLLANLAVSVPAFLAGATSRTVFDDPDLRPIVDKLANEAAAIAASQGFACALDPAGPAAGHKSSMLQDHERGRRAEYEALLAMPQAFARAAGIDTPVLDTIAGLAAFRLRPPVG